jgi:hypothetical protein
MATFFNGEHGVKSKQTLRCFRHPAQHSLFSDEGEGQQTQQVNSPWSAFDLFMETLPVGLLLKTCPKCFWLTEQNFGSLCVPHFQEGGIIYHGKCLTLNTLELRKGGDECLLSDILEAAPVQQKYYLTPTRCRAVLRQAQKRGKGIPQPLRSIIESMALESTTTITTDTIPIPQYQEQSQRR